MGPVGVELDAEVFDLFDEGLAVAGLVPVDPSYLRDWLKRSTTPLVWGA